MCIKFIRQVDVRIVFCAFTRLQYYCIPFIRQSMVYMAKIINQLLLLLLIRNSKSQQLRLNYSVKNNYYKFHSYYCII